MASIIEFQQSDIEVGSLLGTGGFSTVHSVDLSYMKLAEIDDYLAEQEKSFSQTVQQTSPEQQMTRRLNFRDSSEATLEACYHAEKAHVVKRLKPSLKSLPPHVQEMAAEDLKHEVKLLSELSSHPNIVTIYGVSSNFWEAPEKGFLCLERLVEPLDKALAKWKKEASSGIKILTRRHLAQELQAKRIQDVAIPVARAMAFLHDHNIIFRDLKPGNCGFGTAGIIRLFDFGFARRIDPKKTEDYKLTGHIGTLRYMAPEVASSEHYGFPADVHSFAMLLWEVCTLQKPFAHVKNVDTMLNLVMNKDAHPPLKTISFIGVQALLSESWQWEARARPTFNNLIPHLEGEVERILDSLSDARDKKKQRCI
mmetsp:Transcript_34181/g.71118  ORF Transcript_34181/g.71118 Transcript_34181/m.71118 type:complete len:367 (+) Transcript_34181:210-1310(+)